MRHQVVSPIPQMTANGLVFTFGLLLLLVLTSCASVPTPIDTAAVYRNDLRVKVNGVDFLGVGVVDPASEYKIEVLPNGKIDRIIWRMCDGEDVIDKPDTSWPDNKFSFTVKPTELELKSSCGTMQITVLEEKKRRNGFALLIFKDLRPEISLKAKLICNKTTADVRGVSICQSAAGLYSQITFERPVVQVGSEPRCDVMTSHNGDGMNFIFALPRDECNYFFVDQKYHENGKRLVHMMTTVGYTEILPGE